MACVRKQKTLVIWQGLPILFLLHATLCVAQAKKVLLQESSYEQQPDHPNLQQQQQQLPKMHTLFSVECNNYFDWQTVGLMHSYRQSGHPGPITRLLSCTDEELEEYRGMDLAPTHVAPSMSRHPKTGDWYPAINKPAGVLHWLQNSDEAKDVDWVVILDADMIIRHPIVPWELGAEKGKPIAASYGYLIGCDNILAQLHTRHPEYCDKVGGLLVMHLDDLRALAPLWLSKTEEVRADTLHWATNITGDIYAQGWISEMYGYSFGAAEVGLRHKVSDHLMIYPGYIPEEGTEPVLLHYGLRFTVGNWSFSKANYHEDGIVYDCNRLFPPPPYPKEVLAMEPNTNKRNGLFLSIECVNTLNEGLLKHHEAHGCSRPSLSKYIRFLKVWRTTTRKLFQVDSTKVLDIRGIPEIPQQPNSLQVEKKSKFPRIHTLFSTECSPYFDWQTLGIMHSFGLSGQPGPITRLLSCKDDRLKTYKGLDLAPTHVVPSYSWHPLTGDWYPAINKPASVLHWLNHAQTDAEFVVILDADMILRGPITPWEFGAEKGHPVSAPYDYLIGCDNVLAKLHTRYPEACDKVGGIIIMHIDDLRAFAPLWLHKTEEVRADKAHWDTNITGDIYGQGWISEMYGYSFAAAELKLRHRIRGDIMLYPGYVPPNNVEPRVLHYGLEISIGSWRFDKADWREEDVVNTCWKLFPDPPDLSLLSHANVDELRRDTLGIECVRMLNSALYLHHKRRACPEPTKLTDPVLQDEGENTGKDTHERKKKEQDEGENTSKDTFERELYMNKEQERQVNGERKTSRIEEKDLKSVGELEEFLDMEGGKSRSMKQASRQPTWPTKHSRLVVVGPTYWMVVSWSLLVFVFLLIVSLVYSSQGQKQKPAKSKG